MPGTEICLLEYHSMSNSYSPVYLGKVGSPDLPTKPTPDLDPSLLVAVNPNVQQDSYVYVHCYFHNMWTDALIRIWRSSFLIDRSSGARSPLVHVENISIAPMWTLVEESSTYCFLLIFEGLPKACRRFDFVEEISQPGGFYITNIQRNPLDVYHIEV